MYYGGSDEGGADRRREIQIVAYHQQVEHIVARNARLLAPVTLKEMLSIEVDEVPQQTPKRVIRRGLHRKNRCAAQFRQFPYAQRQFAHCAECSSSSAVQRPEQIFRAPTLLWNQ
jgi:hypothetical protein